VDLPKKFSSQGEAKLDGVAWLWKKVPVPVFPEKLSSLLNRLP